MKLASVAVYYEPIKAWIDMNLLESEGVPAVLENESLLQNVWLLGEAAGQIRLMVAEGNSENASASDPELNARELLIDRALRGSLVTFFFLPISILVACLLFRIMISDEAVRPKYLQKLIWTSVLNVPVFLIVVFVMREMLQLLLLH